MMGFDPIRPGKPRPAPVAPIVTDDEEEFQRWKAAKQQPAAADPDPEFTAWQAKRAAIPGTRPDVTAARAYSPAQHGLGDDVNGLMGAVSQGASFGTGDEIAAGTMGVLNKLTGGWMLNGKPFQFEKLRQQAAEPEKLYAQRHPVGDFLGQAAGAVGAGMAMGPIAGVASGGEAAATTVNGLTKAQRALRAAKAIGGGAATGAGVGFASGEGSASERVPSAMSGALFGGGLVAGAKGAAGLSKALGVTDAVRGLMPRPATASSPMAKLTRGAVESHQDLALQDILADVERSGVPLDEYLARAKANPNHPLYDLGPSLPQSGQTRIRRDPTGDPLVRRARGAQSIPSRGSAQISDFINARSEERPAAVKDALRGALGVTRENTVDLEDALKRARSGAAAPKYDAAYATAPVDDPEIQAAFKDKYFASAYETGRRIAASEGVQLPALRSQSVIGGEPIESLNPLTVQGLDYAKQGLDDLIERRMSGGKMGKREARALRQKLNGMLERLDEQRPEYADARRTFREGSQAMEGAESGHDFWRTSGDELEARWRMMTPEAKQQYRKTALASIEDRLGGGANPGMLLNEINRRKLSIIAESPEGYDQFERALRAQVQGASNDATITGNSATARIQQDQAELGAIPTGLASGFAGGAAGIGKAALSSLVDNSVARRMRGLAETRVDHLAPILTAKGDALAGHLEGLKRLQARRAQMEAERLLRRSVLAGQFGGRVGGSNP